MTVLFIEVSLFKGVLIRGVPLCAVGGECCWLLHRLPSLPPPPLQAVVQDPV